MILLVGKVGRRQFQLFNVKKQQHMLLFFYVGTYGKLGIIGVCHDGLKNENVDFLLS